ncbi:MAG: hypothetical protein GX190_04835 [Mollicutes bacterium]|nr:hypothetical protein [Mollicutes bacterium]
MKKKLFILLLLILIMNVLIFYNKKENDELVFADKDIQEHEYAIYNLNVDDLNITSKNVSQYFQETEVKILGIYPKINKLYQNKFSNKIGYYSFNKAIVNQNLTELETMFKKLLKDYGLNNEIEKVEINGVGISKIRVYASNNDLKKLLNNNPKMQIE